MELMLQPVSVRSALTVMLLMHIQCLVELFQFTMYVTQVPRLWHSLLIVLFQILMSQGEQFRFFQQQVLCLLMPTTW